ncbi:MAG: M20 family metallopeptidase [Fusobacterium perfoetens]|uniref:M20 metallopeptidase family protein n=1 Tax=Fusobacterium perfoetens TaxID=852 RepID=UPI0023F46511|nr:M20 family metallopeptidase [Fusobacterium perfoetens]MCI6152660.1 M20 family metallopeptidase [Fusobacterium perfoetens]MDY3237688.1 M20 family metallopeptidase [Fusobacterium perfoetens]
MKINDLEIRDGLKEEIINFRRYLHQNPELSNFEFNTTKVLKEELEKLGLEIVERKNKTGIVGIFKNPNNSENCKTILIRADIDALPMEELTNCPYKSQTKNVMHSCGHDEHTAALLGAIKIILDNKDKINGNIKFLFQHSEELGSGAKEWVDEGVLSNPNVDAVLGYHVMPIPEGKIGIKENEMCAASTVFEILIKGVGGHGAYPHKNINPIFIGTDIIQKVPGMIINKFDALDSLVINFCTFNGGTKDNIVPESVRLSGTIRSLKNSVGKKAVEMLEKLSKNIAEIYGGEATVNILANIPAVENDSSLNKVIEISTKNILGEDSVIFLQNASMGSEDFGHLKQENIEGAYFYIGYYNEDKKYTISNHNPQFDFDDSILFPLSLVTVETVINYFNRGDK